MLAGTPASYGTEALKADAAVICFARGTMIRTPSGDRRIEHLAEGDLVVTLDSGPQPVRWTGARTLRATGAFAPIRFARGAIGNNSDLLVSPHHRMLLPRDLARRAAARSEVLAPAESFVDDFRVFVAYGGMVTYHHILFDRHQVVIANGAPSESFHPDDRALATLEPEARDSLFRALPALRSDPGAYGNVARPCITAGTARALRAV